MSAQPADIREGLEEDIASAREWRAMKVEEFPDDNRNAEAVAILDRLGTTLAVVPDGLLLRFQAAWERGELVTAETWSRMLRQVGFYSEPATATDLIESFLSELAPIDG